MKFVDDDDDDDDEIIASAQNTQALIEKIATRMQISVGAEHPHVFLNGCLKLESSTYSWRL